MKIKTYQAPTMQEALQAIKAELGPEAVILSTAQHPTRKNRLGYKMVEVTAAVDMDAARARSARVPQSIPAPPAAPENTGSRIGIPFDEVLRASLQGDLSSMDVDRDPERSKGDATRHEAEWYALHAELRRIRERLDSCDTATKPRGIAPPLLEYYERLVDRGIDSETAHALLDEIGSRMTSPASNAPIRAALHGAFAGRIRTSGPLLKTDERKKTVILVGPTGVGKTTTIAKLAAYYRQHGRRSVALVTLDTYRMAAVEQLRMYADLIGVPMDVALTRGDAVRCLAKRHDAELILVDTAGRSPADAVGMTEVRDLLSVKHPVEVHLVLSATTRERDLMRYTKTYRGIPFDRLLFTKLDETSGVGGAFELMRRTGVPLSYVCTGQRVPEDLELAQPERLAELLVGDSGCLMPEPARVETTVEKG